jgi:hypothetical protein
VGTGTGKRISGRSEPGDIPEPHSTVSTVEPKKLCMMLNKWISGLAKMAVAVTGVLLLMQCTNGSNRGEDRLLAEVYGNYLFLSDLEGMIPEGMSSEDSSLIIDAYINRWVRDAILLEEAERNIPESMDIDKLVADYRSSLLLDNYKKALMDESLDSTITTDELTEFYERHQESYRLEADIVSAYFMTIPRSAPNVAQVRSWWNSFSPESLIELRSYCEQHGVVCLLNDEQWFEVDELLLRWPPGSVNDRNLWNNEDLERQDEDFFYFYHRSDRQPSGEIAPIAFVEEQIQRLILHQRKIRLVEETQDRMYERAMRNKDIRIY